MEAEGSLLQKGYAVEKCSATTTFDVTALGDDALKAAKLVAAVKKDITIDWTVREDVCANILKRYGYPPDMRDEATKLVIEHVEVLSEYWAA